MEESLPKTTRTYTKPMGTFAKRYWAYVKRSKDNGENIILSMKDFAERERQLKKEETEARVSFSD